MNEAPLIALLGMDGCGKTTVIKALDARLNDYGLDTRRRHLRPHFGRPLDEGPPQAPAHDQPARGVIMSAAKACLFGADYVWARLTTLRAARQNGTAVIFDRYMHDVLADPERYRYGAPLWIWRLACRLAPRPDCIVLIDVPADVAVHRKGELTIEQAEQLRDRYQRLARQFKWTVVDGTKNPETIAQTIVDQLPVKLRHSA